MGAVAVLITAAGKTCLSTCPSHSLFPEWFISFLCIHDWAECAVSIVAYLLIYQYHFLFFLLRRETHLSPGKGWGPIPPRPLSMYYFSVGNPPLSAYIIKVSIKLL